MAAIQRPSTPFPYTHTLVHSATHSYFEPTPLPYGHPLHFHLTPMPSPVPPSLLAKRRGAPISPLPTPTSAPMVRSTSRPVRPRPSRALLSQPQPSEPIPAIGQVLSRQTSNCPSECSTSSSFSAPSPSMPITPHYPTPQLEVPTPLALPSPLCSPALSPCEPVIATPPELPGFSYRLAGSGSDYGDDEEEEEEERGRKRSVEEEQRWKRPGTPVQFQKMLERLEALSKEKRGKEKRFRSVVDGGSWVVLG
ncbi:hypothetical protein L198_00436 [Cryptococcus wingfieldii CBS 7118]|uniref:Uncharacterized protein n=1 Tax=Cryptococcus wingfieldii CBS 7118 TaxID=1295528 RepID=A0A1E3K767_9TREE|nr:hypothetical protein L198_00436 [Cryptococcus wingfieldii CBS 7118]ODO08703.1 hypothetical protein L198_00436 [Cryptococcus wingfieldii CBS 7118]